MLGLFLLLLPRVIIPRQTHTYDSCLFLLLWLGRLLQWRKPMNAVTYQSYNGIVSFFFLSFSLLSLDDVVS